MRRVQNGRLGLDEDGVVLEPELVEDDLAAISGDPPRTPADALGITLTDPAAAEENISKLEDYAARYLHQDLGRIAEWTWEELLRKFENIIDMVRAENGKPPRGVFDPNQTFT